MTDIHAFIEARLAEDEAVALAAPQGGWSVDDEVKNNEHGLRVAADDTEFGRSETVFYKGDAIRYDFRRDESKVRAPFVFAARFDPVRALLEIEARRTRLKLHRAEQVAYLDHQGAGQTGSECEVCGGGGEAPGTLWPCETLKTDALPYADHLDFDPQWSLS